MLIEFSQSRTSNSFKMPERAIPINFYQFLHELLHMPCGEKIAKNPSTYILKSSKNPVTLSTCSTSKLANVPAQMQLCQTGLNKSCFLLKK